MHSENTQNSLEGLFLASYEIGNTHMMGNVRFHVSLLVNTADRSVTGVGNVTQPVSPPVNIRSELNGEFHYQCTMKSCHIMVNLSGTQPYPGIPPFGVMPIHNTQLAILLDDDWKQGTANFSYLDDKGEWQEVQGAPVTLIDSAVSNDIARLAETVSVTAKTA